MKTILSIIAIITFIGFYSTGAFVPETQGIVDTVAGLEVLSDTDMAQQVGGFWHHYADVDRFPGGDTAVCTDDFFEPCDTDNKVRWNFRLNCVECDGYTQYYTEMWWRKVDGEITSTCEYEIATCTYDEWVSNHWMSCELYMGPQCR